MDKAGTRLAVPLDDIWSALVSAESELLAVWLDVHRRQQLMAFDVYAALADDVPLATPRTYAFLAALLHHGYQYVQCATYYTLEFAHACIDKNVRLGLQWVLAYGGLDPLRVGALYDHVIVKQNNGRSPRATPSQYI
jgi:hypothetical protein